MQYPENSAFMIAAYTIAAVVVLVYAISLFVRLKKISR